MTIRVERDSLARFARDILVIIVGVLIALGFDNWATGRGERRLEREYHARLARDLRADSAMLADSRRSALMGESAARELARLIDAGDTLVSDSVIGRYFSDATRGAYLAPNNPTILELQATGNLRVLRDENLRDALLTYYARVGRFQFSLETVMRRGRDPLGELGWDIRAFDPSIEYAVDPRTSRPSVVPLVSSEDGTLLASFRAHRDARRVTHRALTYNALLRPILADWDLTLERLRTRLPR